MVRIDLLGPVRAHDDGDDLSPLGQREQLALACLALSGVDGISTERLADELYADRETTDPRNAVQAAISRLRKALGEFGDIVVTVGTGYRLDFERVGTDIAEVEALLTAARYCDNPGEVLASANAALAMWRGRALHDLAGGDLIDTERLRLGELRASALELVLAHRVDHGDHHDALADLEAAVREEPLRERRWELLMLALYRSGRQVDALRAYQRARGLLRERLGLDPSPGLVDLEQRILAHDESLATSASGDSGADARKVGHGERRPLPSGTVSVLLCDIEGSVRRWELDPDDTEVDVAAMLDRWTTSVEAHQGVVVKTMGDGLLAAFDDAAQAVTAAVAAQQAQQASALAVRCAVHTATARPVEGDYRGALVNRCARLLDLAHGGQVLTTGVTAQLARGELATELRLRELGRHWLRDVAEPVEVFQVDAAGLQTSFPALRSAGPSDLPRLRHPLLGRSDLHGDLTELVGDHALVTLLGPGGVGKTSLALSVGWQMAEHRRVCFVDLAGVASPDVVAGRVADSLAVVDDDDAPPVAAILERLTTTTDLVIVDNAEHLVGAVAALLDDVLAHDIKGSFLVTSRRALGVAGEVTRSVEPLNLPDTGADLRSTGASPAVRLFVERAAAARPDLEMTDGLLPVVAHICRRLDGLPLAIELAAGRAAVLSIDGIAAHLDDQIRLLRQVPAVRDGRHRSIDAVVAFSLDHLDPTSRLLFGALGPIVGEFGLEHAQAAGRGVGIDPLDVLDSVAELAGVSLVTVQAGGSRYRVLEPVRQFAAAELEATGRVDDVKEALIEWLLARLETAHRARAGSGGQAHRELASDLDLLRAVVEWSIEAGVPDVRGRLAISASWLFLVADPGSGALLLGRLVASLDRDRDPVAWARAVVAWGIVTATYPDSPVADEILDALPILDAANDPDRDLARIAATFAQAGTGNIELMRGLVDEAERLVSSDDIWARAIVDMSAMALNVLVSFTGSTATDTDLAIARGERAIAAFRSIDDTWALGATLGELGRLYQVRGDLDDAEAAYLESLELIDDREFHGNHRVLTELGRLASVRGDHDAADRYHREAQALADETGSAGCRAEAMAGQADAAAARGDIDEAIAAYRAAIETVRDTFVACGTAVWEAELANLESLSD